MTTNSEIFHYKNQSFRRNEELDYLELIIDGNTFHDDISFILSITIMSEYCEKINPKYVIVNRLKSDFIITSTLRQFVREDIFGILKSSGVKNYILLVKESVYEVTVNNTNQYRSYIRCFTSIEDMEDWMIHHKV